MDDPMGRPGMRSGKQIHAAARASDEYRLWAAAPANGVGHTLECLTGCGTERTDRRKADDDDQRQHDRVLDGRWAILRGEETADRCEPLHRKTSPYIMRPPPLPNEAEIGTQVQLVWEPFDARHRSI